MTTVAIPLNRNLTVKRLPEEVRDAKILRLIIFQHDLEPESEAKMVYDIIDYDILAGIRYFNKIRHLYSEKIGQYSIVLEKVE